MHPLFATKYLYGETGALGGFTGSIDWGGEYLGIESACYINGSNILFGDLVSMAVSGRVCPPRLVQERRILYRWLVLGVQLLFKLFHLFYWSCVRSLHIYVKVCI